MPAGVSGEIARTGQDRVGREPIRDAGEGLARLHQQHIPFSRDVHRGLHELLDVGHQPHRAENGHHQGRPEHREADGAHVRQENDLKIRLPFVPPNPNELESARSIFISRAVLGT